MSLEKSWHKNRIFAELLIIALAAVILAGCNQAGTDDQPVNSSEMAASASSEVTAPAESTSPINEDKTSGKGDTPGVPNQDEDKSEIRVAKDGADMQTEDKTMPTRKPMEGGTKINMYFGDTLITGVLNDSETAKALIEKLPVTQHVSRYSHDFCGVTDDLPYNEDEVHYGWLNGDIDYAINAPYFTILFEDEDVSEQYGDQVNIGVITVPLSEIAALEGSYDVRIELAE